MKVDDTFAYYHAAIRDLEKFWEERLKYRRVVMD